MIPLPFYSGKKIGVFGLGKAGEAAVSALIRSGAEVFAWDDKEESRNTLRHAHPEAQLLTIARWPWEEIASLVLSPGIPYTHPAPHPVVNLARARGVEIIGDIELLWRARAEAEYIGITGTNGKSTTTTLIAHILKSAGKRVEAGGNLGTPALALSPLDESGIYVLELSSYQLDLVRTTRFHIAALLNLTPDHLDRHDDMEGYLASKMHIFDRQGEDDIAIIATEDAYTIRSAEALIQKGRWVRKVEASPLLHGIDLREIPTLAGRHNQQNAAVAYAAAYACGVSDEKIAEALRSFPGLAHRMEQAGGIGHVRFVNDSKATNADAASNALAAYERIYWIAGGKPKAGGIVSLEPFFPKIVHAFLIGEAAAEFASTLKGHAPYTHSGTLDTAVAQAAAMALADPEPSVVLLSPACASFDQFKSFEERGEKFCELVNGLRLTADGQPADTVHRPLSAEQRHAS